VAPSGIWEGKLLIIKTLIVLLWPVGMVAILAATTLMARRPGHFPAPATAPMNGHRGSDPAVSVRSAWSSVIGLLLILAVGAVVVYALTALLGMLVVHAGAAIDKPIYTWTIHHRLHFWKLVMDRVTKVGDTWTIWGDAAVAAVCLAAFYRKNKWLPPVALGAAVVLDHYLTLALRHTVERSGPPASPHGTFPSGGCARVVVFCGLIAYLIWREVGGDKQLAIWASGVVAALGFSEAYSRGYLTLHWFTDIISGLIYGAFILTVFIVTIRLVDGPARRIVAEAPGRPAVASRPAPTP
jgi:membrane-associated phospholipid phosphatase